MKKITYLIIIILGIAVLMGCNVNPDAGDSGDSGDGGDAGDGGSDDGTWEETKFEASDGSNDTGFGFALALSDNVDRIVVGANRFFDTQPYQGKAYIYSWHDTVWDETGIMASGLPAGAQYGFSVDINSDGSKVIVGAPGDNSSQGSAYLYEWTGFAWDETEITPDTPVTGERFGTSVSITGDGTMMAIGANGSSQGQAYVFEYDGSNWNQVTLLSASDGISGDEFGYCIGISDNESVVVGAYNYGDDLTGAAYVYTKNGTSWDETKLIASDGASQSEFAWSVDISQDGNSVVVGAKADDNTIGTNAGAVYLYQYDGSSWDETKFVAEEVEAGEIYGSKVAINHDGTAFIVGARWDDEMGSASGSAYLHQWDGSDWIETKFLASDGALDNEYGSGVAINNDGLAIMVGASVAMTSNNFAYLYEFVPDE
jgi:hypothetical protein